MDKSERKKHQDNATEYLDKVSGRYEFDRSSGLYKSKSPEQDENSSTDTTGRYKRFPFWVVIKPDFFAHAVSIATLVLLVGTVIYTRKQWKESNRSANASEIAANAAKSAADTAKSTLDKTDSNFQMDERPWVVAKQVYLVFNEDGKSSFSVKAVIGNTGRSPAFNVKISNIGSAKHYGRMDVDQFLARHPEYSHVSAPAFMQPGYSGNIPEEPKSITPKELDDIEKHRLWIYAFGDISYSDVSGNQHFTRYCGVYDPTESQLPDQFSICDSHNFVDRNK